MDKLIQGAQQIKAKMDTYSEETENCWGKKKEKKVTINIFIPLKKKKKTIVVPFQGVCSQPLFEPLPGLRRTPGEVIGAVRLRDNRSK